MNRIEVTTQDDLDRVLREQPEAMPILIGAARFVLWGNAHAELRGNARAVLWGNAHADASGAAHLSVFDRASANASNPRVAVHQYSDVAVILGGTVIRVRRPTTPPRSSRREKRNMSQPSKPTALTPEEQAFIVNFARETEGREWNERALVIIRRLDARVGELEKRPQTVDEIHERLGKMMHEEEALLDDLERLGDKTYEVSEDAARRTRQKISVVVDLTRERDELASALEDVALFLKSVTPIHDYSGGMNATQLGRRDHFARTVAAVDAALAQARQRGKETE